MGIINFKKRLEKNKMPAFLINLALKTKENCKIQSNNLQGVHIGGSVTINDSGSGENFCGNAGDTSGGSSYTNSSSSSANSSSSSSGGGGASSAGHNAMQNALNNKPSGSSGSSGSQSQGKTAQGAHGSDPDNNTGSGSTPSKVCGGGWGQSSCLQQIIILI